MRVSGLIMCVSVSACVSMYVCECLFCVCGLATLEKALQRTENSIYSNWKVDSVAASAELPHW